MPTEYRTPGVYVEEVSSGSQPISGAPTNVVGFIGSAKRGVRNKAVKCTSFAQYFNEFIGDMEIPKVNPRGGIEKDALGNDVVISQARKKSTDLDWAVYLFFANGGTICYVVNTGANYDDDIIAMSEEVQKLEAELGEADDSRKPAIEAKLGAYRKEVEDLNNLKNELGSFNANAAAIGNDGGPGKRTGIHCLKEATDVAVLCAPGYVDMSVQAELLSYAETFNIFTVLDAPKDLKELEQYNLSPDLGGLAKLPNKCLSKQSALYFPWAYVGDPESGTDRLCPPTCFVPGVYARVDNARGVHKAPANEGLKHAKALAYDISDGEQEELNVSGVNVIRNFTEGGIKIWGARTTVTKDNPEWRYVNVRRLFNMIEKTVKDGTGWAVFEPNDQFLWSSLRRNVTAFMLRIYNTGALQGGSSAEAFFVRCDASTNPQENIDAGVVTIEIGIAPVKPAEFIVFKVAQIKPGQQELVAAE